MAGTGTSLLLVRVVFRLDEAVLVVGHRHRGLFHHYLEDLLFLHFRLLSFWLAALCVRR